MRAAPQHHASAKPISARRISGDDIQLIGDDDAGQRPFGWIQHAVAVRVTDVMEPIVVSAARRTPTLTTGAKLKPNMIRVR